jgi:LysR family hydrogen peroxide-inducible transcriptional activator
MDLRAASLTTLCRLVSEGFGLTLLPELAVRAECAGAPELRLARFEAPEPARTIGLVRRTLAVDDGWFGELGTMLAEAGRAEVEAARAMVSREGPSGRFDR